MRRPLMIIVALAAAASLAADLAGGTSAARPSGGAAATVSIGSSSLGRILVDGRGRTLYLFEKDTRGRSTCSGTCATYWPPLLMHGRPIRAGRSRGVAAWHDPPGRPAPPRRPMPATRSTVICRT